MNTNPQLELRFQRSKKWAAERPSFGKVAEEFAMRWAGRMSCLPHACLGSQAGQRLGILAYHRVVDPTRGISKPLHNVTPGRFEEQISGLLRRGWQVWPLKQVLDWKRQHKSLPSQTLVITFDDGFQSVYDNAWPLLRRWGLPFTVFVATQYLDSEAPFPFDVWGVDHQASVSPADYRPLTIAQCREMLASGLAELGAHTHSHEDFRNRPEAFRTDLIRCVDILRQLDQSDISFAYPYGSPRLGFASRDLQRAACDAGVTCGLTTQAVLVDLPSDPYCWGRFNVFAWDTSATLAAKLAGWYSWSNRLRRWCSRRRSQASVTGQVDE